MKALLPFALLLIAAGPDMTIAPGKWTTTIVMDDVKIAGAPPGVAAAMKGSPVTTTYCVTPEQARQGVRGALKPETGCRFTDFSAVGGRIRSRMTCDRPNGAMTAVSAGTYTPTGYMMASTMTGTGRMAMTMTSRATGRRVGPC